MLAHLQDLIGASTENWLIVIGAGLFFLAVATLLPDLIRRYRGKPPLL
jgi:hypothetical protein